MNGLFLLLRHHLGDLLFEELVVLHVRFSERIFLDPLKLQTFVVQYLGVHVDIKILNQLNGFDSLSHKILVLHALFEQVLKLPGNS